MSRHASVSQKHANTNTVMFDVWLFLLLKNILCARVFSDRFANVFVWKSSTIVWSSFMRDYCRKLKLHWKHNFSPLTCWPTFSQFCLGIVFGGFSEPLWENTPEILRFKMCSHTSSYSNESIRSGNTQPTRCYGKMTSALSHMVSI